MGMTGVTGVSTRLVMENRSSRNLTCKSSLLPNWQSWRYRTMNGYPFIVRYRQLCQFGSSELLQVKFLLLRFSITNLVDTPVTPVMPIRVVVMALVLVVPIDEINRAVRATSEVNHL